MEEPGRSRRTSLLAAEGLLLCGLVLTPLALGTVHLVTLAPLVALVAVAAGAAAWARPRAVPWPVLAAIGLVGYCGLQLVPLPRALLYAASPHALEILERALGPIGRHALSLDTASTAREFGRLLGFALALFAASRLASDERSGRRLALGVALMGVAECLFIVGHKVVATNAIYGVVPTTQHNLVLGTFGNANHLAAYLTLAIPLLLALSLGARERGDRTAWLVAAAVACVMVMLTGSRSGVLGLFAALAVLGVLLRHQLAEARRPLLGLGAALGVGAVAAVVLDAGRMAKFTSLLHVGRAAGDIKVRAWGDVPALVRDYWLTGIGRGAYETVFPGYKHVTDPVTFTHAENAPLQLLADFGLLVGVGTMVAWLAAIVLAARREQRAPREESVLWMGAAASLAGITVHELGDFSLDVSGAVGLATAVLFGLLWPARRLPDEAWRVRGVVVPQRALRMAGVVALAALGAGSLTLAFQRALSRDVRRVNEAAAAPGADIELMAREAIARHPVEPWFHFMAALDRLHHHQPLAALPYLNRAMLLDPTAWRPHQLLAEALLELGRRGQALLEYRLAYVGSGHADVVAQALLQHKEIPFGEVLEAMAVGDAAVLAGFTAFLDRGRFDEQAVLAGARLLERQPGSQLAHRLLGRVELRRKGYAEVIAHARQLPPGDAEALLLQVQALDALGKGAQADALLSAADRDGSNAPLEAGTAMMLAERALARKHPLAALGALDRVQQDALGPEQVSRIHELRSLGLEATGKVREAILEAERAARLDPGERTWFALASIYERMGMMREALLVYRGAVRSTPRPSDLLRARLARAEEDLGAPSISGTGAGGGGSSLDEPGGERAPGEGEEGEGEGAGGEATEGEAKGR